MQTRRIGTLIVIFLIVLVVPLIFLIESHRSQITFLPGEYVAIKNYINKCYFYAKSVQSPLPEKYARFYELLLEDDFVGAEKIFETIEKETIDVFPENQRKKIAMLYTPTQELYWLFRTLERWPNSLRREYQAQLFDQLPENTIIFSGAEGRFLIPYSMVEEKNIIVISLNAIADMNYLKFVKDLYGKKIWLPSESDYTCLSKDLLSERKGIEMVMEMNSKLCEEIFNKNNDYNFFVEGKESPGKGKGSVRLIRYQVENEKE